MQGHVAVKVTAAGSTSGGSTGSPVVTSSRWTACAVYYPDMAELAELVRKLKGME